MTGPVAVAWDIDGTLVDSEPVHLAALVAVSARYGLDLANDREDRFLGQHLGAVWDILSGQYPKSLAQEIWVGEILAEYAGRAHELKVMAAMLETIHELDRRGVTQVCVSNSERPIVDINIALLGIADRIVFSISRDDIHAPKPDPAPYLLAATRLGIDPARMIAVEDSDTGARSAQAAGLGVVRYVPGAEEDTARRITALFAG